MVTAASFSSSRTPPLPWNTATLTRHFFTFADSGSFQTSANAMGNVLSPCLCPGAAQGNVAVTRLVFWGGLVMTDNARSFTTAGDVTVELSSEHSPERARWTSFIIGLPVLVLAAGEQLLPG
jgi:hypothetical protein